MAKKNKIPTSAEIKAYLDRKEEIYRIHGYGNVYLEKFPGMNIWSTKITLPLVRAAEEVGFGNEAIWPLCRKMASVTHVPVNQKEFDRMIPFAEDSGVVDTVLKMLETYIPPLEDDLMVLRFDISGYFYMLAIVSLSEYRIDDCEKMLWKTVDHYIEYEPKLHDCVLLVRSFKMAKDKHQYLVPMIEKLEAAIAKYPKES